MKSNICLWIQMER